MKDLVVITGGTRGLGLELVKLFCKKYSVLVLSRKKMGREIQGVMYEKGDISDEDFLISVYKKYAKNYRILYLINNAGVMAYGAPQDNNLEKIEKTFKANLTGLILNTAYAIPLLNENGAKIVNILSTAALKGNANESLYCAAKWGARGYTESLKALYKGTKTKVVSVYPGGMNTGFWDESRDYVPKEKSDKWLDPKKVAKVVFDSVTNDDLSVAEIVIERV